MKPATTHFELLWQLHKSFGSNSAACLLSYSLAPHFQYHVQLQQAVALLRYLVTEGKKNPEEVIIRKGISRYKADRTDRLFLLEILPEVI